MPLAKEKRGRAERCRKSGGIHARIKETRTLEQKAAGRRELSVSHWQRHLIIGTKTRHPPGDGVETKRLKCYRRSTEAIWNECSRVKGLRQDDRSL